MCSSDLEAAQGAPPPCWMDNVAGGAAPPWGCRDGSSASRQGLPDDRCPLVVLHPKAVAAMEAVDQPEAAGSRRHRWDQVLLVQGVQPVTVHAHHSERPRGRLKSLLEGAGSPIEIDQVDRLAESDVGLGIGTGRA